MAKAFINDENLTDIADAIRATLDESRQYLPSEMAAAIQSIPVMAQLNRKKYFQPVPAGAASGYATIEQIEGNTVVWNQLVDTGIYANVLPYSSVVTEVSVNSDNEIEVKTIATAGASYSRGFKTSPFSSLSNIVGHKYLLLCESKSSVQYSYSSDSALMGVTSPFTILDYTANQWCTTGTIITAVNTNNSFILRVSKQPAVGSYYYFRNFQLIDLTRIFGSGNEPTTVADFEAWREQNGLPDYADYNAGELLSVKMQGVRSVGFNQWDEDWEVGSIDNTTGQPVDNDPNNIRSKNYCRCFGNKAYYVKGSVNIRYYFYDGNFSFISSGYTSAAIVTTPTNAAYFKVRTTSSYGNTYNHDICINISDPAKNGTYEPYQSDSADIDVTTITGINPNTNVREVMFASGMKQADSEGTIKDTLDLRSDTATVRCYDINLGNLQFTRERGTGTDAAYYFYSDSLTPSAKNVDDNTIGKFLCSKYNVGATNNQRYIGSLPNLSVCVDYLRISIRDDNYTDAATFKTAMNGVHLIYELATPITYTDLQDANGDPLNPRYKVEHGGTEHVLPANTSTPTTVAPTLSTIYKKV